MLMQIVKSIFSNDYLGSLRTFLDEIQGLYIIKAENALNQMKKVDLRFLMKN